jgi:hypothetical protein
LQFIENTEQEKRNFYEMMVCNDTIKKQLKLSFDIDLKEFMCNYKKHGLVQCIISKVMDLLNDTFRLNIKIDDFVIIDSSSNEKTSFHIILNNYHFENVLALRHLRDTLFVNLFNDYAFLDKSIYNPNKLFRLPMCTKIGQQRHLIITSHHTFNDAYPYEKPKKERIPKSRKTLLNK